MTSRIFSIRPLAGAALAIAALAFLPGAARAAVADEARIEAEWILQAQLPDGSIATQLDHARIWPYLANFAAIGLARASELAGDPRYADAAWRWLQWYAAHQDASGFVTDYDVVAGRPVSTGQMDSTDAYAGTFLLAAKATWLATQDRARVGGLATAITAAVKAIEATQQPDGLTWAKPDARVKYLMDQGETYAGLRAAVTLAGVLGDGALRTRASRASKRLRTGVAGLWNPATEAYDWAVHENGVRQPTNWAVLYPDALQQAWAVAFGLARGERAASIMSRFERFHPSWDRPATITRFRAGQSATGYWAPAAWAFGRVDQPERARLAARRIRQAADAAGRAWPFTPSDSGQLVVLADPSRDALNRQLGY